MPDTHRYRLCAIKASNTYKIYVYDADGNRIAKGNITPQGTPAPDVSLCSPLKNSFSITQAYAIDLNGQEIENYTPGVSWHNTNVYNGNTLIATYAGNYMSIPTTDWQGTRRAQLPSNQSTSGLLEFISLPYGDGFTMVGGTNFDSLVQFTQQQYNQEDNLYNFKARYYGDWVGRFMRPDPSSQVFANPSNPQTLNLYGYVANNPLSHIDPWGLALQYSCTTTTQGSSVNGPSGIGADGSIVQNVTVNSGTSTCTAVDDGSGGPTSLIPTQEAQHFTNVPQINTACPPVPAHPSSAD